MYYNTLHVHIICNANTTLHITLQQPTAQYNIVKQHKTKYSKNETTQNNT